MIGSRIGGRYEIIKSIGDGGMSKVYLAHDMILNRDVAIKVLNYDFANEEELKRRFQREALSATSLTHPHIVDIFDVGEDGELLYLVMELVEGQTLKEYIQSNGPLAPEQALPIMRQLVSAISNAHHNGIIHRDIKPQNILMDADGNLKITDFGIAMALSATAYTKTNSVIGTVHYLSPEQARGGMATKKSDIYSLGIVFYELLTGKLPFSAETAVAIALKHLQEETPSVRALFPSIPQSVENVILKATMKDPSYRYSSADDMYDDLLTVLSPERAEEERFSVPFDDERTRALPVVKDTSNLENLELTKKIEPVVAKVPPTSPTPAKKQRKKWPWIVGGLAGVLVLVLLLLLLPMLLAPKQAEIPKVAGEDVAKATDLLEEAGFQVDEVIELPSDEVEKGEVIRTVPEEGKKRDVGSLVKIYVSKGKEPFKFADYRKRDYDQVVAFLESQGFKPVKRIDEFSDEPEGLIIEQNIEADSEVVPEETDVVFTVSKGKETQKLADLRGFNKSELANYEKETKLDIQIVKEEYHSTVPEGQVIWQKPSPNTDMTAGEKVEVALSKGEEKKPMKTVFKTVKIEYVPKESEPLEGDWDEDGNWVQPEQQAPVPQEVKIYIQDKTHTMADPFEVFKITEDVTRHLKFELEEGQIGSYMIMRDNQNIAHVKFHYDDEKE